MRGYSSPDKSLAARAVQYLEPGVVFEGPKLEGVYLTNDAGTAATLTFHVGTAANLHLAGTVS